MYSTVKEREKGKKVRTQKHSMIVVVTVVPNKERVEHDQLNITANY